MKVTTSRFSYLLAFGLAVVALTALVQAHTKLEKSEPRAGAVVTAAPGQIQLWFNEKLDAAVSKIDLTSPSGKVDLGPAHAMADKSLMAAITGKLGDGTYTVGWQTAGDDGHVVKGDFTFTVKLSH
ncbi:MAG TPA: copper resistance CopC family protein [Vicinamibacterales bacterium]|jgi:methionine-rich copper-binding protein CopC|nr:copper resistance CopC family protein [Vicinamibacterales bacterium]